MSEIGLAIYDRLRTRVSRNEKIANPRPKITDSQISPIWSRMMGKCQLSNIVLAEISRMVLFPQPDFDFSAQKLRIRIFSRLVLFSQQVYDCCDQKMWIRILNIHLNKKCWTQGYIFFKLSIIFVTDSQFTDSRSHNFLRSDAE